MMDRSEALKFAEEMRDKLLAEYIEREAVLNRLSKVCITDDGFGMGVQFGVEHAMDVIKEAPAADVVEVVHGYSVGDVCLYGFGSESKSLALVEIVKILNDERGVAELKFLKVFADDTGNGLFNYLLRSGQTMNGSFKYLANITPNCGAKMDGERKEPNDSK